MFIATTTRNYEFVRVESEAAPRSPSPAAPAIRPPCEGFAPVPEAEDLQELLVELGWQGHPVSLWRALHVLGHASPENVDFFWCNFAHSLV